MKAADEKIFEAVQQLANEQNESLIIRVCKTILSFRECKYCEMKLEYVLAKLSLHRIKKDLHLSQWRRDYNERYKFFRFARNEVSDIKSRLNCLCCTCDGSVWRVIGSRFTFLPLRRRP